VTTATTRAAGVIALAIVAGVIGFAIGRFTAPPPPPSLHPMSPPQLDPVNDDNARPVAPEASDAEAASAGTAAAPPTAEPGGWQVDLADSIVLPTGDAPTLGPADASVAMVLFADPAQASSRAAVRALRDARPADGRVVLHPIAATDATFATRAALAAARRGSLDRMLLVLDAHGGDLTDAEVREALAGAGLDGVVADAFGSTLDARLTATATLAATLRVEVVPTVFVGAARLEGVVPSAEALATHLSRVRDGALPWSTQIAAALRPLAWGSTF